MHLSLPSSLLPVLLLAAACRAVPPEPPAPAATVAVPAERAYTLVFLKTGPKSGQVPKEENDKLFQGHFSNMERMVQEGQLVLAGPFGRDRHDPALRGIFVVDTAVRATAESWARTDPPTQAGVFVLEFHDLATSAPLRAALEADVRWSAEQAAQGKTPAPGDGARGYVLLTAENGAAARSALGPLMGPEGGVFMLSALDGARALALLDAATLDAARARFAAPLAAIGPHALDEWFATRQLALMGVPK